LPDTLPSPRRGIVIPIRLASERLPGKALLDVAGRPAVHHLLDRAVACRYVEPREVIVCTTREAGDDALAEAVEAYGASVYRGPTDDLIRRLGEAVEAFALDHVVEADGDDLCCAAEYMDKCFEALAAGDGHDVVTCAGLPLGIAPRGFTAAAMARVMAHCESEANDTGFFYLFTRTGLCRERTIEPEGDAHRHDRARLTLDYPEDLEFFRALLGAVGAPGKPASLAEIVAHMNAHPELVEVNREVGERFWARMRSKTRLAYRDERGERKEIAV